MRLARTQEPRAEITGSPWQASTEEVRNWARSAGFEPGTDSSIPEQAVAAYNQTHPDRPYRTAPAPESFTQAVLSDRRPADRCPGADTTVRSGSRGGRK
jgi:hypothetical protein